MVTEQALEGEEARYGERLIQFASENLVTEILIHPVVSTLAQCMRNLLSSFTKHRHIIHAGYTFAANGSWALQDGTFSYTDFAEAFQELEVQRVIRAYENGITIDLHCSPEGDWTKLPKEQFTKACKVRLNPSDVLTSGSPAINNFINYISPFLIPTSLESLLESSDVVGNIRFSRPTLYVFPGGQGDAALFGINGFNMLLDGGYGRKACFWDFVRHLDRLDAVLMTRLNNSNVGGISSVLRRKKQDALYPQIGHFFCNLQERKALLSPDGDKDRDPLLINLLDEGQEIVSNLRHLHLTPQVCYRDSEPINLYHKVGHGTLDMYILSPAKDSKEVREFLHKWNQSDVRLFANAKSSREFSFPLQNLVSIAALLVWQPADPEDTITRILFPGSCPQTKIFEGLDRLKSLEFVKSAVCSEKSLSGTTTKKAALIERIATKDKDKIIADKKENKMIENNITEVNIEVKEKTVKKSDSTESDKSIKQKKIDDHKIENGDKAKPKPRPMKPRSDSQQRRKPIDKKASPKKIPTENGDVKRPIKPSPIGTPAKSAKDASNRRVIESKVKQPPAAPTKPSAEPKPKVERKPISRRPKAPKAPISPVKKLVNGVQKPDSISRKGRLDKEGTTDSSTVSTPSVDQESVLKKDISKLTPEELQQLKAQELADLKEEQEAVKEIEAVFRKGEGIKDTADDENLRKVKDVSIDEEKLEEKEEYLIIEKEVIQQDSMEDKEPKEDETQKLARDSEESEKRRKPSVEEQRVDIESQINGIVNEAEDIVKSKDEHVEGSKVTSPEDKGDSGDKKLTDEVKDVVESHPDEKVSVNIKSGDTTTAPTLPEDEKVPLDEIKEDSGHVIEEKHVKEDTKEKDVPMIPPPPKPVETVGKIPSVIGIDDGKSDVELPDQKSTTEKVSGRESPLKKVEDASIKTISGKSTPDKDASIKSIASGKSTPDISDLEQSKDTDEFKKTEEDMSIEAVEKIEAETVAKKDERPEQKPEELTKPGDSHTKEQKEDVKDKKEDKREEEELGYIRDTSPKDLDYDANKVENDKTPEKSPSKAHDHLKKESDIEEEQLFRKPSLKADELLKKDIQEVQQNFFDSDAKDTVITDGIDIDETSPVQISPSDGKPLQDEIQECVEKDIKAEDAKQHAFEAIQENFVGDLESKSVKQTDDFLRKEIEAEQHDFVSTVSKDDGAKDIYKMTVDEKALGKDTKEEQIDGDDKVSYHTLPKAEFPEKVDPTKATGKDESSLVSEHLREEIKEVQDSFVDSITKDTTDEAKTVIESAERIDEKISSKSIGTKDNMKIEHKHEDAAKKDMTVAENIEEGYKESLRKSSKAEEALKEEIRELQESLKKSSKTEEMLREEIRDLQHPTESKTDKPKDVEQMKDDTIGIKEAVEEKPTDKDLLPRKPSLKAEELLKEETQKVQQSFVEAVAKDAEAETKSTDNDLLPRKSSLKAEELLKKEIDEVQEPRVKSVVKDAEAEITSSEEDEMLRKPSLKGEELLKKQIEEVQESFVEAVSKDAEAEDLLPRKPSLKDDELVKKEIQVVQGPFIEAVAKDVEAETKSTEEDLSRKSSLKPDELVKKEIQGVQESFVEAVAKDSEAETKSMEKDLSPRKPSLNADELLKKEILEVQESFVEAIAKDSEAETKSTETDLLPPKPDELLKKEIQEVQGSFVEAEVKDAEAETKSMEKDLLPRKPSLKPDELLKKEIQEVQQSFVEGVAKDAEADTKSTEKDLLHRKPSLKPDDLLKKETQEVQESLVEAVAKHAETEIKSTEKDLLPRKPSLKADELVNKEIQEVQESFVEAVVKDAEAETKSTEKDGLPRKPSLKADEVLKKEIQEVQESFVEAVAKDSEAETKSTDKDLSRKPSLKADELLKKEIQDVQESFVESVAKDAEAETKTTEKDSSRKPSLKADELLKKELQEVQESFVEAVAKDSEAETKSTEKDLLSRKPSLKADELLKKEIQEVQESFIEAVTKDAEFELKEESHADVESPKKAAAEETKDTTEVKSSTDRRSSLTSNGLIKDAKSHQKDERIGTRTESEKEQIIKADEEIKKAIKEIQDEFIESVAEDFVIIDRIKKDDTVALEEATVADEFDSKVKSPSVKETPEKALEQSAAELADTFKNVTDMSKSVMFDKCETSTIDPTVVKKDEEDLEKKAEDIEDAYETVNALAKSISFEKLTDKSHKKDDKICVTDGTSTITTDNVSETSQKDGKLLERHADGTEDSVPKPEKSIKFEVEEKCEINKTTKKDEDLLKERASDIEDAYETVSKLAKTIPFEKVEDTLHIDKETLKKDEKLLEQRADDIEDAYDTVKKLATDISFEKVDSGSHIDQAVIEHDEKILEQTAGDVEKAYDTVTKLSKRISFDKVEDKRGDKDNVPTDVTKHSTAQEQTIVESGKRVTDETAVEKVRKDSISRSRKESLSEHTHEMDIHTKSTLEVTHSSSQAKKLSISDVEILLTGDKSAGDKDISGAATPPTVPVSPNIKEASSPEVRYTEYTESDSHFNVTEQMDPMCMSFYGSLPEDDQADEDIKEGAVTHLYEVTKAKFSTPVLEPVDAGKGQHGQTEDQPTSSKDKDSDKSLGKPLGLPPPPYPTYLYEITKAKYSTGTDNEAEVNEEVQSSYLYREMDMMNTSFYGSLPTEEDDIDPLRMWGKPLGLPSPAPPNDNKGTPKKERKLPSNVSAKNKLNDDKKRAESPSKHNRNKKNNPIYVDLTYVPHHGNTYYAYVDFFKRIRARYYVFSGIEPSREVYNALLEAKQTWEDKDLEVTIIPTYDTDVLGYWVAENEDLLAKYKIDLSPSASRCTINLQDHETSCSAYRLEF
ncbi:unnamed protein product [Acanthoscelides obtectus]|uniref:Microtubule-associated protein futsch n=1 Tax=Acanthoscelides obtectus TaxID=200917 RepID=A0A9P0LG30_ACAOB|nr:unnamed protein product [Acanthoscelides obtectus]CAK1653316.1 Microtubule-associated protein futsch [Acanthoscelides obtectus]